MNSDVKFSNDYYVIGEDFKIISFNKTVKDRYAGIKAGDYCYKTTMNRESPCLHCPIAGNTDNDSPIYFDPFYNQWIEAIFCKIDDKTYSVTCRPAKETGFALIGINGSEELKLEPLGMAVNTKLKMQVHEHLQIIDGLNKIFFIVCMVDFNTRTFRMLTKNDRITDELGQKGTIDIPMDSLLNKFVAPESRQTMKEFSNIDNIRAITGQNKAVTHEYQSKEEGWSRAVIIPVEIDENQKATKIIYAVRTINDTKEKELRQKAEMEEQMAIITGLAAEYYSVMLVDYEKDAVHIHRANGEDGEMIGEFFNRYPTWTEGIKAYTDTQVVEEEKAEFFDAFRIETIKERTEDYSFNYQKVTSKGIIHLQFKVAYVHDQEGCRLAVVGTRNIEKEFQNQIILQKAQRELARSYNMIVGLSKEYYTLIMVTVEDRKMHLFRYTEGISILGDSNKLNMDNTDYNTTMKKYIHLYVQEKDKQRVWDETCFDTLIDEVQKHSVYTVNYLRQDDNKNERHHQMVFAKTDVENGSANIVFAFRDVDNIVKEEQKKQEVLLKALEAAEYANHAKTRFLNNMSHDIRTPLNAIIGFSTLASNHLDNAEQLCTYLHNIDISSKHLLSLINDVLDMSRIESGKVKIDEKENSLCEVLHELCTIVQSDIIEKNITFCTYTVDVVNENVICDKLRLNQVIMNILSNAIKFTDKGGSVSLSLVQKKSTTPGYAEYEFHVKDTGIGMNPDFIEHVFEPFEREATSTVSGIQGTGLGMSISKNIVDMMGGKIIVTSEPGIGSEFVVKLQFKTSGEAISPKTATVSKKCRALVAVNDIVLGESIYKMLLYMGIYCEKTFSGQQTVFKTKNAIERGDEFDLYIIDEQLSDMSYSDIVSEIKNLTAMQKPIIVLSNTDIDIKENDTDIITFCNKPVFMSELIDAIQNPHANNKAVQNQESELLSYSDKKILLVEDNKINQNIAIKLLQEYGFDVEVAGDGDIAVEKVKNAKPGQYDLILMDIQMPVMNGYEATREIRKIENAELSCIPIIAMTANAFDEDIQNALDAGMNAHIAKPIDVHVLKSTIENTLKQRG